MIAHQQFGSGLVQSYQDVKESEGLRKDDLPLYQCAASKGATDSLARSCKAPQRADALMMEGRVPILVDDGRLGYVRQKGGGKSATRLLNTHQNFLPTTQCW